MSLAVRSHFTSLAVRSHFTSLAVRSHFMSLAVQFTGILHRHKKQFHFGGPNVIYTVVVAICAACMNINKVSRIKYWGALAPPRVPRSYVLSSQTISHISEEWLLRCCYSMI